MDKIVEKAIKKYPGFAERRIGFIYGYRQAEKDLIPLINRLCEAILFDLEDKVKFARKIQIQIKEETK